MGARPQMPAFLVLVAALALTAQDCSDSGTTQPPGDDPPPSDDLVALKAPKFGTVLGVGEHQKARGEAPFDELDAVGYPLHAASGHHDDVARHRPLIDDEEPP